MAASFFRSSVTCMSVEVCDGVNETGCERGDENATAVRTSLLISSFLTRMKLR